MSKMKLMLRCSTLNQISNYKLYLLLLFPITSFAQHDTIYKLAFSNKSNFSIINSMGAKIPKRILVLNKTQQWSSERFWIDGIKEMSAQALKRIENDEHHAYNVSYIFKDSSIDKLLSDSEKYELQLKSDSIKPKLIQLSGKDFSTISSTKNIVGFYFKTTEPIFSNNGNLAFIDIHLFNKEALLSKENNLIIASICIVFQKNDKNQWKRLRVISLLWA